MANDRLYLKCVCGDAQLIFKYSGGGEWWHWRPDDDRVQDFLEFHTQDCFSFFGSNLDDFNGFDLRTEATVAAPHSHKDRYPDLCPRTAAVEEAGYDWRLKQREEYEAMMKALGGEE
jgi:hypothetical protein